jgi:hypothetical protein
MVALPSLLLLMPQLLLLLLLLLTYPTGCPSLGVLLHLDAP